MGVLSDIIIAGRDEAADINAARRAHMNRWPCLDSKGIDTIKLGTLSQIIADGPLDDIDAISTFMTTDELDAASDEGPWIFLVPEQLKFSLAAMVRDVEMDVAQKWAATEEFALGGWDLADVSEYLHGLIAHARRACFADKSLLLWMSL